MESDPLLELFRRCIVACVKAVVSSLMALNSLSSLIVTVGCACGWFSADQRPLSREMGSRLAPDIAPLPLWCCRSTKSFRGFLLPNKFLLRDADMHSACTSYTATWLAKWLADVIRRYCIKTAKPILKRFIPSGSPIILVSSDPCAETQFQGESLQRGR